MEKVNKVSDQEVRELTVQLLEEYMLSLFIDRRIFITEGVPTRYVDGFIRYNLREYEEDISLIGDEEFLECYRGYTEKFMKRVEETKAPGVTEEDKMSPFEEMEWMIGSLCYAKRSLVDDGADEDEVNRAFIEQARDYQEYVDALDDKEFDRLTMRNVLKSEMKHKDRMGKVRILEKRPEAEVEETEMDEESRQIFYELSAELLEGFLDGLYMTKRILVNDGIPEDEVDSYIAERTGMFSSEFRDMDEDEFIGYLEGLREELEERSEEELLEYIDPKKLTRGMLDLIDDKVRGVLIVTRGLAENGISAEDTVKAVRVRAAQLDELYMNMERNEFDMVMLEKILEVNESSEKNDLQEV